ncbi:merozoite surface antigen 2, allelic form 2-like [Helianthus annuus]|uniref:merozoite surface antigen 2, allelic form 2-like n=1 Tax=Helianthus annuus TaxID=4232 RepID=UPI001652CFC6|nr:merozoite surface antigen 2, allelic form 2-like [Helianthus annuus]
MSEKFGPEPDVSDESGSDNGDEGGNGGDGGDAGAVGASSVGTTGGTSAGGTSVGGTSAGGVSAGNTSAGGDDEADSDSDDDLLLEPGYEMYLDECGVRRYRKIRQEDDPEYVPSDPETERARKGKAEKLAERQKKKKARRYLSTSSRGSVPQAPIPEPPVVSSPSAAQPVSPQATPQRSMAASIRATTAQPSGERQRIFTDMTQEEKNNFLFMQFEAAADRIQRQTDFIRITKNDQIHHQVEIDRLKSTVGEQQATIQRQQAEIDFLKAENVRLRAADEERQRSSSVLQKLAEDLRNRCDVMKEWYDSRNTTILEGASLVV